MPIYRTQAQWQELLAEFAHTSQTRKAFCQQKGIDLSTFNRWQHRLSGTSPSPKPRAFIPVAITPTITGDITLTVGSAIVTLPTTVSPIWVAELLSRLGG